MFPTDRQCRFFKVAPDHSKIIVTMEIMIQQPSHSKAQFRLMIHDKTKLLKNVAEVASGVN